MRKAKGEQASVNSTVLFGVSVLMAVAGAGLRAQSPDFSGTWKLEASRSHVTEAGLAGVIATGAPETLHITHAANGTVVLESQMNEGHARIYTPGGKSSTPVGQGGSITMTSTSDSRSLVSQGHQETAAGVSTTVREVISISPDRHTLTIEVNIVSGGDTKASTLVYTKAQTLGPCESWPTPCKMWPARSDKPIR